MFYFLGQTKIHVCTIGYAFTFMDSIIQHTKRGRVSLHFELCKIMVVVVLPDPFRVEKLQRPNSWATPQGLDQR